MEKNLIFEYDEVGDILYINKVAPYAGQETDPLAYNVMARRNPGTGAIENIEVLFFTQWLLKGGEMQVHDLGALFATPAASAPA
jgi:hypothetical protein